MPRAFRSLLPSSLVLLLALAGCAVFEPEPRSDDLRALTEARARWTRERPARYSFVYAASCYCAMDQTQPAVIAVAGSAVGSVQYADGSVPTVVDASTWPTIDRLFQLLDQAYARRAAIVRVRFDARLGYPVEAFIDYDRRVADDEHGFVVSGLAAY